MYFIAMQMLVLVQGNSPLINLLTLVTYLSFLVVIDVKQDLRKQEFDRVVNETLVFVYNYTFMIYTPC